MIKSLKLKNSVDRLDNKEKQKTGIIVFTDICMMKSFCRSCDKEQIFDDSWDSECLRCSECGSLNYGKQKTDNIVFTDICMVNDYKNERGYIAQ